MALQIDLEAANSFSETSAYSYDVFLSFRGQDTRYGFSDHLFHTLKNDGFLVFRDKDELETGEPLKPELVKAIKGSKASIIVLSENYASSRWCLDELVLILERKKNSSHIVIPIFYHVDPSDVRNLQNSFAEGLAEHDAKIKAEADPVKKEERIESMERWKKALAVVGNLSGMAAVGYETKLLEEIAIDLENKLNYKVLSTKPDLIGMHSQTEHIESWFEEGTFNILTIYGMVGIGKIAVAEYIFASHSPEFERSCYLAEIGKKPIIGLQEQLLTDLRKGKQPQKLSNKNSIVNKIEKVLLNQKVLLVLDGVDKVDQLNNLLGGGGVHRESKIIITTKDKSLTKNCELVKMRGIRHQQHQHKKLGEDNSLELLCRHAFGRKQPKEGFEEQLKKLAEYCAGHPLALIVLGRSLYGQDIGGWGETLKLLRRQGNKKIQRALQASLDILEYKNDKDLFLHIACFFVGEIRHEAEAILQACGLKTSSGIQNLIDRCLLTIGPFLRLTMHQLLQDLGRGMVREESRKPGKRSRLWDHEDSIKVLKEETGTKKVKGLILDMQKLKEKKLSRFNTNKKRKREERMPTQKEGVSFGNNNKSSDLVTTKLGNHLKTDAFAKMDKLKLLLLYHVKLTGSYTNFPKELIWLCWHGFPLESIPMELEMSKVVRLDMSYSKLKQVWEDCVLLKSLKILDLRHSKELETSPNFSGLPYLESLILASCESLVEVCESIGDLKRLILLDLTDCIKLRKLPDTIRQITSLERLIIDGCSNLEELPTTMRNMTSLKGLDREREE